MTEADEKGLWALLISIFILAFSIWAVKPARVELEPRDFRLKQSVYLRCVLALPIQTSYTENQLTECDSLATEEADRVRSPRIQR